MAELEVTVLGTREVARAVQGVESAVKNASGAMRETGTFLTGFYSGQVFASRGGAIGHPWQRLNPRYAAWKARRWSGRPPLVRTGEMQDSFEFDAGALQVRVHNVADHFRFHQLGEGVPQRLMMDLNRQLRVSIVRIIDKHLTRNAGLS